MISKCQDLTNYSGRSAPNNICLSGELTRDVDRSELVSLFAAPQIFGVSPGSGSGGSSCPSFAALGGGSNTISRFTVLPLPLSFCASGSQHWAQISYSLPSISFCRQSFTSPHRSQTIIDSPLTLIRIAQKQDCFEIDTSCVNVAIASTSFPAKFGLSTVTS